MFDFDQNSKIIIYSSKTRDEILLDKTLKDSLKKELNKLHCIELIPLCDRTNDIPFFLSLHPKDGNQIIFSNEAREILSQHKWENSDQIKSFKKRYIINNKNKLIDIKDLPSFMKKKKPITEKGYCLPKEINTDIPDINFLCKQIINNFNSVIEKEGLTSFSKQLKSELAKIYYKNNCKKLRETSRKLHIAPSNLLTLLKSEK
jgi:DNA-binding NtrC family response regulator